MKPQFLKLFCGVSLTGVAMSCSIVRAAAVTNDSPKAGIEAFIGARSEKAGEHVYYHDLPGDISALNGRHLSRLDWRTEESSVAGINAFVRVTPKITLRGGGWVSVDLDGRLTDYDWSYRAFGVNDWTDRSKSHVNKGTARGLDVSGAYRFYEADRFSLDAIAGYRARSSKWHATGGDYVYSADPETAEEALEKGAIDSIDQVFRIASGSLPRNERFVSYKQQWRTPYLGVGATYKAGNLTLAGELQGSIWARGKDRDDHWARGATFSSRGERSRFVGLNVTAEYRVSSYWALTAALHYDRYLNARADLSATESGEVSRLGTGAAGLDSQSAMITLGMKASF